MIAIAVGASVLMLVLVCAGISALGALLGPTKPTSHVTAGALGGRTPPATAESPVPAAPAVPSSVAPSPVPTSAAPATTRPAARTPSPAKPRTSPTKAAASTCGAPPNPYGFTFCRGAHIYLADLPADVCSYFTCIDSFWNGKGYLEECHDGSYSMSGGRQGACSHHGGEWRPVYRH